MTSFHTMPGVLDASAHDNELFMADQDLLDEFLDQRVYEAADGDALGAKLDHNYNLDNLDSLDIASFYQPSPHGGSSTAFHSPELGLHEASVAPAAAPLAASVAPAAAPVAPVVPMAAARASPAAPQTQAQAPAFPLPYLTPPEKAVSSFDFARLELAKLRFGNTGAAGPEPSRVEVPHALYVDFLPAAMNALPYRLEVANLPAHLRVETQIKLKFVLSPPPPQFLLHIPQDLVSKSKFCLKDPVHSFSDEFKRNVLFLDTYVLTLDCAQLCLICTRCIKREQKRALRRKLGAGAGRPHDDDDASPKGHNSWLDENMAKRAIIYNCKEIVLFPPPTGLANALSKSLELLVRIVCYCRHHKEAQGFKLLFVVTNYAGEVVAKTLTLPIMIMDRKKTSGARADDLVAGLSALTPGHPLSPSSVYESNSDPTNTDTNAEDHRGLKRKKLSVDDLYNTSSNPMFNGSANYSPISNSDTNTSTHNLFAKAPVAMVAPRGSQIAGLQPLLFDAGLLVATIQRIIPAQGPIRGGIEVTLLGFNFRPGLMVKFGLNQALATHCWSETTIVTYLPPALQAGQVLVSFENESLMVGSLQQQQVFTYTDDTDRQLIELALQIVGLKMNGKLEDAKNIAKRIVGTDDRGGAGAAAGAGAGAVEGHEATAWFDNAHKAVEILTKSDLSTEDILTNFLSLVDLPNCPITLLNWQLCNAQGQTLLHLATLKNYANLAKFLIAHGCKLDVKDTQGLTPLFFASMCGHRDLIAVFLECRSNHHLRLTNDKSLVDYCDPNVMDMFNDLSDGDLDFAHALGEGLAKSGSVDSLNSLFMMNYGRHILKMVAEESGTISAANKMESGDRHIVRREFKPELDFYDDSGASDLADSEYESDDADAIARDAAVFAPPSLWQKVKNVFNTDDDIALPSYDDLFPQFLPKEPAAVAARTTNRKSDALAVQTDHEDLGVTSDLLDESLISHRFRESRKLVQNDKMLMFFWFPALIVIGALFFAMSVMGYQLEFIEGWKLAVRSMVGNLMVGSERVLRVFQAERGLGLGR